MTNNGQFKPGSIPYNKGIKRGSVSPQTEFKPGQMPSSFLGYGVPRPCKENASKRLYVTIPDKTIGNSRNRAYIKSKVTTYARYLWESVNGKIPPGHVIYNNGNDPLEIILSNLELISRAELLKRNLGRRRRG